MNRHYVKSESILKSALRNLPVVFRAMGALTTSACALALLMVIGLLSSQRPGYDLLSWPEFLAIAAISLALPLAGFASGICFVIRGYRSFWLGTIQLALSMACVVAFCIGLFQFFSGFDPA